MNTMTRLYASGDRSKPDPTAAPRYGTLVYAAVLLLGIGTHPARADEPRPEGWKSAGNTEGVALAQRENTQLNAQEVRAIAEMDAAPWDVFAVVADCGNYPGYMPGVLEARILEGATPSSFEVYMRYKPQFIIIAARDVILRVNVSVPTPGSSAPWRSAWECEPKRLPEVASTVRIPLSTGSWTVEGIDGDRRSRVTYQVAVKPGGAIPDWLVRWGAARALPELMHVVRDRVKSNRVSPPVLSR
jgi:hypothetical protein